MVRVVVGDEFIPIIRQLRTALLAARCSFERSKLVALSLLSSGTAALRPVQGQISDDIQTSRSGSGCGGLLTSDGRPGYT